MIRKERAASGELYLTRFERLKSRYFVINE